MSRLLPTFVTAIVAIACLTVMLTTLYVLTLSHWHGPFRDMWEIYPFLEKIIQHSWGWQDLWESYGYAHRLVIPRLLFIADYQIADASNHLLIGVSIFCQLGIIALFAVVLFVQTTMLLWQRWCFLLLVIMFQFSGTLLFNFMHTFDVQWFLCCFLVVASFYALTMKNRIAIAGLLIAGACLCNFSAMAAWPVWAILLFQRIRHPLQRGIFVLAALGFIALCSTGIRSSGLSILAGEKILQAMAYFFVQFPLLYLGNPLSDLEYLPLGGWAVILVIMPLLLLANFGWRFFKNKITDIHPASLFLAALMLFGVGVAFMTGLGRGYDPGHVQASRYQNIVLLFWSAALPFLFMETKNSKLISRLLFRSCGIFFVVGLMACQRQSWNENLLRGRNVSRAHLALMMGYSRDVPMIAATVSRSMIYVPGYNLEQERLLHEQSRKGIYEGAMATAWLDGVDLALIHPDCAGVEWKLAPKETPYTRFVEFSVTGGLAPYDYALLVDKNGKVVAIAEAEKVWLFGKPAHWRGFSRVTAMENMTLLLVSPYNQCISH